MSTLLHDVALLAVGALLGFLGSFVMWRWQLREERKKKRTEHILRAVHLAISSLTHVRCLLSAKTQGMKGYLNLPENPVDELMSVSLLYLHEIIPLVQKLHDKQQELFAHGIDGPDAADSMLRLAAEFPPIANHVIKKLENLSKDGRLQSGSSSV
jgi:hypothetical protein